MSKKKIVAILLFIFLGLFMFTYASPKETTKLQEPKNKVVDKDNNTKDEDVNNIENRIVNVVAKINAPIINVTPTRIVIIEKEEYNLMTGVKVISDEKLKVETNIVSTTDLKVGTHNVTYSVTDSIGQSSTATRTIVVLDPKGDEDGDGFTNEEELITPKSPLNPDKPICEIETSNVDELNQINVIPVMINNISDINNIQNNIIENSDKCEENPLIDSKVTDPENPLDHPHTYAPKIILEGNNPYEMAVNTNYSEDGFDLILDSHDNKTKKEDVVINSDLDNTKLGIYSVQYSVVDMYGKTSSAVRKVTVKEDNNNNGKIDEYENHYDIEFEAGDHGILEGQTIYENILTDLTFDQAGIIIPTVKPNRDYKFKGWTPEIVDKVIGSVTYKATYFEDKNNNNKDDLEELVTVTFNSGLNGKIDGKNAKQISNLLPGYDRYPVAPIVTPKEGYKFMGWMPFYPTGMVINARYAPLKFIALYYEDKNDNNRNDRFEKHYNIKFQAGDHGRLEGQTVYKNILTDLTFDQAGIIIPTVKPNKDYKFKGWTPEIVDKVTGSVTYKATYFEDKNNNNKDDLEELVTVTFNSGLNGKIDGKNEKQISNLLPGYDRYPVAPIVTPKEGYKFMGWMPFYPTGMVINARYAPLKFIAIYYEDKNDNNKDDSKEKHYDIKFEAGINGRLEGQTTYRNILTDLTFEKAGIIIPTVKPNKDYNFKGWTPGIVDKVTGNVTYKATYYEDKNNNGMDDNTENHYIITFEAGINGRLEGQTTYRNILTDLTFEKAGIIIPTVKPNKDYNFKGWTPEIVDKVTGSVTYKATYYEDKNNNDKDDSEELVTVTFNSGLNGTIDGKNAKQISNLLPGYDRYPVAPIVTPNEGYKFIGWNPSYKTNNFIPIENATLEFTAKYYEDKNNNNKDDNTESHYNIKFEAGDYGTLEGETIYENVLKDLTFEKAGIVVPTVIPNKDYKFKGWTPEVVDKVTRSVIYRATYFEDKNNNNVDDNTEFYTVKFINYDGRVLKEEKIRLYGSATAPINPQRRNYTFIGWDRDFTNIEDDLTIKAKYSLNQVSIRVEEKPNMQLVFKQNSNVNIKNYINVYRVFADKTQELITNYTTDFSTGSLGRRELTVVDGAFTNSNLTYKIINKNVFTTKFEVIMPDKNHYRKTIKTDCRFNCDSIIETKEVPEKQDFVEVIEHYDDTIELLNIKVYNNNSTIEQINRFDEPVRWSYKLYNDSKEIDEVYDPVRIIPVNNKSMINEIHITYKKTTELKFLPNKVEIKTIKFNYDNTTRKFIAYEEENAKM